MYLIIDIMRFNLLKYINLQDHSKYNYYLAYGKFEMKDHFNLGSFVDLSFGFVKDTCGYVKKAEPIFMTLPSCSLLIICLMILNFFA